MIKLEHVTIHHAPAIAMEEALALKVFAIALVIGPVQLVILPV